MNQFSRHEALDRTYILSINLESALSDSPITLSDPKAKQLYEEASKSLTDLYQHLGQITNETDYEK